MRLNTAEWGSGPPLVCLHGVTSHGRRYETMAARLPGRRVLGVDLRGHAGSGWDPPWTVAQHIEDLVETAAALEVERADWVGHSFGGLLVARLTVERPDLVSRAVLLDPALHIDPAVALERAEAMRADISFASPDDAIETRLGDGTLFTTPRSVLEREAEQHLEQGDDGRWRWRYCAPAVVAAFGEMAAPAPAWPRCPTLVVLGARSWLPVDVPILPNVTAVTVPGGHGVLWDDFEETIDAVTRFLASAGV
ncbi:MAG: alpha/beta fold hydrolase [Gaiella sp.]